MTTRFYVTMTWDDWPEGGSYGTVVEATDYEVAEALCRQEMAASRCDDPDNDEEVSEVLETYADEWEVVDCFDLDQFIADHQRPAQ